MLGRPRFGARNYVDLEFAKEPSVYTELFVNISNVFNAPEIAFNDVPTGQRHVTFGVTKRF
ncbi:MAG: hypothetical protein JOZ57_01145 [Abitibacteriaceae bacterium]|nr:hypothetical protein [Abditibacteriaceae bacterium]